MMNVGLGRKGVAMLASKLPPGPWRVVRNDRGSIYSIDDAEGIPLIYPDETDYLGGSPEVLRAVESLPLLIEAARGVVEWFDGTGLKSPSPEHPMNAVRATLALVEGKGKAEA